MATILIVDDRQTNREFLMTLLGYTGHRLLECDDGTAALEMTRKQRLDLIICDMVMPTMNGLEFVSALRSDASIAHIPVIFYTAAFRTAEAHALARSSGVAEVLAKPTEPQVILDTVGRILGIPRQAAEPALLRRSAGQMSKQDRTPTIRSRLALLVVACMLPASLMVIGLITYNYDRERTQLINNSIGTVRAMRFAVEKDLASAQSAMSVLATSPHLASDNLPAFYGQAKEVLRIQNINNITLSDASGQQRVSTVLPFGASLPLYGNPAQLRRVFETGQPVISDLFIARVIGKPLITVAVPVRRGDAVVYNLSASLFPQRLSAVFEQQHLPPEWIGAILDSTGTIVARTHEMERFVGKQGSAALLKRVNEVPEGFIENKTLEGIPVLAVFSRSPASNWTVAIGIPTKTFTAELLRSIWLFTIGTVVLLTGSLGLAWIIGGRIGRAVRALTGPALALGLGERVTVPALNLREADEVANALMKTSMKLHLAQHEAHHDALTGLANRVLFNEVVNQQLAVSKRNRTSLAIFYIDLDGFKSVNDIHGHAVGDALLCAVAVRLKAGIRDSDLSARLGGDEFAIVLLGAGAEAAAKIAGNLIENLSSPYPIGELTVAISASIGIAIYPDSATTPGDLLQRADEAMYKAKTTGKRRYVRA